MVRERRVVRVALVYAVVAWGIVTVAAQLAEILPELPGWDVEHVRAELTRLKGG